MARRIAEFYLWGMGLSLVFTLIVGAKGADYGETLALALLSWPTAGLIMLARSRFKKIMREAEA
ncbi:MAG: hypothetical protein HUJ24_05535 [Rhodobacteraceae bacterium]|nr:hypothetical protein [Paracoccaceae bacterium]